MATATGKLIRFDSTLTRDDNQCNIPSHPINCEMKTLEYCSILSTVTFHTIRSELSHQSRFVPSSSLRSDTTYESVLTLIMRVVIIILLLAKQAVYVAHGELDKRLNGMIVSRVTEFTVLVPYFDFSGSMRASATVLPYYQHELLLLNMI